MVRKCDGRLLAALANQTGGNLYVAEPMAFANEAEKVTEARAKEENARRGSTVGATLADWAHATVYWPTNVTWPSELAQVYPKNMTPLRTDRDTVVIGAAAAPLDKSIEIKAQFVADGKPVDLHWSAAPKDKGDSYAFLPQVVQMAKADDGITLPSVGSAGLAETGRIARSGRRWSYRSGRASRRDRRRRRPRKLRRRPCSRAIRATSKRKPFSGSSRSNAPRPSRWPK